MLVGGGGEVAVVGRGLDIKWCKISSCSLRLRCWSWSWCWCGHWPAPGWGLIIIVKNTLIRPPPAHQQTSHCYAGHRGLMISYLGIIISPWKYQGKFNLCIGIIYYSNTFRGKSKSMTLYCQGSVPGWLQTTRATLPQEAHSRDGDGAAWAGGE